jgi:hypothetical protein
MENDNANPTPEKSYRGITYLRPTSGTMAAVVTAASVTGQFTGKPECGVPEEQVKVCVAEPQCAGRRNPLGSTAARLDGWRHHLCARFDNNLYDRHIEASSGARPPHGPRSAITAPMSP